MNLRDRYVGHSDPLRTERRFELALLVVGALLVIALVYQAVRLMTLGGPDAISPAAESLTARENVLQGGISAERRAEIVQRPLFWIQRRMLEGGVPVEIEEQVAASGTEVPNALKDVELLGIFGAGQSGGAILMSGEKRYRLAVGDELKGWTLDSVESRRVVFTDGIDRGEIAFKIQTGEASRYESKEAPADKAEPAQAAPHEKPAYRGHNSAKPATDVPQGLGFGG